MMVRAWKEPGLNSSERLVLLALADCSDRSGANAYRSEHTIADHTMLALRTVKRSIQALKAKQLISVQELPTNRRATTYQLFPQEMVGGAKLTPQERRSGGANLTPHVGATLTPLGVTPRVTSRVPNVQIPHTPYKEEPVDPVDPGVASLLRKAAEEEIRTSPQQSDSSLIASVDRWAKARGIRVTLGHILTAIDQARATARVSA